MILTISPICRQCGCNDPHEHEIASWEDAKLVIDRAETERVPVWRCWNCGSHAAFWYYYRSVLKELYESGEMDKELTDDQEKELQNIQFACTGDDALAEEYLRKVPKDFEGRKINPITGDPLTISGVSRG